jgi:hypothetical protein
MEEGFSNVNASCRRRGSNLFRVVCASPTKHRPPRDKDVLLQPLLLSIPGPGKAEICKLRYGSLHDSVLPS